MPRILAEYEAEKFLKKYAPVARSMLVKNEKDFEKACASIGFPSVLKIISSRALHKTEINGVRKCMNEEDGRRNFRDLLKICARKKLKHEGILFQEFVSGTEMIIGMKKDSTFGHVIMLGTGGIAVELLKDVSFRVCPITDKDAQMMIDDLKLSKLLYGYRGRKSNIRILKSVLVKISKIPPSSMINELDINPFILNEKEGKIADARIVME